MKINNHMKIAHAAALVLFALFVSRPVSAADWEVVASPSVGTGANSLIGVASAADNDVWAVGYSSDSSFNNHPLAIHWNGTTWSIVSSPSVNDDILFGVDAVASNDVWAVGRSQSEARTLTLHWNGSVWSVVPSPNDSTEDNILFGVAPVSSN